MASFYVDFPEIILEECLQLKQLHVLPLTQNIGAWLPLFSSGITCQLNLA